MRKNIDSLEKTITIPAYSFSDNVIQPTFLEISFS